MFISEVRISRVSYKFHVYRTHIYMDMFACYKHTSCQNYLYINSQSNHYSCSTFTRTHISYYISDVSTPDFNLSISIEIRLHNGYTFCLRGALRIPHRVYVSHVTHKSRNPINKAAWINSLFHNSGSPVSSSCGMAFMCSYIDEWTTLLCND